MATTTRVAKTPLENKRLGNGDYFVIIASCSHATLLAKHSTKNIEVNMGNERFNVVSSRCG